MTLTLTYTFDLPEDAPDYRIVAQASDMHSALWDLRNEIRSTLKHGELTEEEAKEWEKIQSIFFDALETNNITLE